MKLCRTILEGIRNQMAVDRKFSHDSVGINVVYDDLEAEILKVKKEDAGKEEQYFDDITGQPLDPCMVQAARRKELEHFETKQVW